MTFWRKASIEQKLAQIDGGIECDMTIRQIAMNVGATRTAVAEFGRRHGRRFPATPAATVSTLKNAVATVAAIRTARWRGSANTAMTGAFEIFGPRAEEDSLFEEQTA